MKAKKGSGKTVLSRRWIGKDRITTRAPTKIKKIM